MLFSYFTNYLDIETVVVNHYQMYTRIISSEINGLYVPHTESCSKLLTELNFINSEQSNIYIDYIKSSVE